MIITTLDLPFDKNSNWKNFKLGSCQGQFGEDEIDVEIFGILNKDKGNGDFEKVIAWFENYCKENKKALLISHIENERLRSHLINKRGFIPIGNSARKTLI